MINQKDLISRIRAKMGYTYKSADIDKIIKNIIEAILDATSNGEDVSIPGLGKFYGRFIKGKEITKSGIPWLKGKEFKIPDRFNLGFSPSDTANRTVNKLQDKLKSEEKKDEILYK